MTTTSDRELLTNIGCTLSAAAARWPDQLAIAEPQVGRPRDRADYRTVTFAELDHDTDQLAAAMVQRGLKPGSRIALLVPPSIDFIAFTFALFKAGAVLVLIDPGMGRANMLSCLSEVQPDGFVGIPLAQLVRWACRRRFPPNPFLVTVGQRWWWGGETASRLRQQSVPPLSATVLDQQKDAAIIFTTGSTGPPKGVRYTHGNFLRQVTELQTQYQIAPGEVDVPCFPLFALFNLAMGVTTVLPRMDATRPAQADPRLIISALQTWQATQAFASPALWNVVGRYCEPRQITVPSLRRILSAGAPVPAHVLQRMQKVVGRPGCVFTPYGATEALPVASISDQEVLEQTQGRSAQGAGTCVGRHFPGIHWRVIRITDQPIASMEQADVLGAGEIGELIVQGDVVTRHYVVRPDGRHGDVNALAKIADGPRFWHRMGDVGYLDDADRFWFCGRKTHRVQTAQGTMFTIPCEAIANGHPRVYRSALIPWGEKGNHLPVLVVECWPEQRVVSSRDARQLRSEIYDRLQQQAITRSIRQEHILFRRALPVDIRHNAKIFREKLVPWAAAQLAKTKG